MTEDTEYINFLTDNVSASMTVSRGKKIASIPWIFTLFVRGEHPDLAEYRGVGVHDQIWSNVRGVHRLVNGTLLMVF